MECVTAYFVLKAAVGGSNAKFHMESFATLYSIIYVEDSVCDVYLGVSD